MTFSTEQEFSQQLNTNFRVFVEAQRPIDLMLVEVKPYAKKAQEQRGMERFSLCFDGPADILLPQNLYKLTHADLGEMEIFLVPIAQNPDGFRYQAVFNFYV
jgi:hypothetical protein